jgi:hypothetical protein
MLDPTPELPDNTLISQVKFPTHILNALTAAGLRTVGEVREAYDDMLLSLPDLEHSSVTHLRKTLGLPSRDGAGPWVKSDLPDANPHGRLSAPTVELTQPRNFESESRAMSTRPGGPMPDGEVREGRWRPFSHWESLSSEVVRYNIYVQTSRNTGVTWLRFTSQPSWQLPFPERHR